MVFAFTRDASCAHIQFSQLSLAWTSTGCSG
jgi:hypothetical protein